MDFEPKTKIYFCHTGITQEHKVFCKTEEELISVITREGNVSGMMQECSFQRADGFFIIRVDHSAVPYYLLMQCDTVFYLNEEQSGAFWIVGNVVGVDWKNENCSFVRFVIDPFMTYSPMINWDETYAYIIREHIKEDWSADGGNPLFSNMGPAEDFNVSADTPFYSWTKTFTPDEVLVLSPYDTTPKATFNGTVKGNLYTSLQSLVTWPSGANDFLEKLADNKDVTINNVVGVYGVPGTWQSAIQQGGLGNGGDESEDLPPVNEAAKQLPSMPEYNNAKCYSSPYMSIRLMSSEGGVIDFTPQWLGNDVNEYTVMWRYGGCGGMFAGAQCTLRNKNGAFNWDVWNDFIVSLSELPSCPWTGDGFRDWYNRNIKATMAQYNANSWNNANKFVQSAANTIVNPSKVGDVVQPIFDEAVNASSLIATIDNQKAAGATVRGIGSFNSLLDVAADTWGFKIVYYTTQQYTLQTVDNYFDRFGYRINRLKKLDLQTRPIWNYVKTAECHVNVSTGIPIIYETAINRMFDAGVTIWNREKYLAGRKIGDFSNPKDNRGIKGG